MDPVVKKRKKKQNGAEKIGKKQIDRAFSQSLMVIKNKTSQKRREASTIGHGKRPEGVSPNPAVKKFMSDLGKKSPTALKGTSQGS